MPLQLAQRHSRASPVAHNHNRSTLAAVSFQLLHTQVIEDDIETGKWVSRDGSSISWGGIDPETDYFDPDGAPLFDEYGDDGPDDEHYEGFTGNAGGLAVGWTARICELGVVRVEHLCVCVCVC